MPEVVSTVAAHQEVINRSKEMLPKLSATVLEHTGILQELQSELRESKAEHRETATAMDRTVRELVAGELKVLDSHRDQVFKLSQRVSDAAHAVEEQKQITSSLEEATQECRSRITTAETSLRTAAAQGMSLFRDLRESAREEARKAEQSATARIPMEVAKALAAGGTGEKPGSGGDARAFRDVVDYPQEPPPVHRHTTAPVVSSLPQPTGNPRRTSPTEWAGA